MRHRADQILDRGRSAPSLRCSAHRDERGSVIARSERCQTGQTLAVDDGDACAGITQAISEIIAGSPGIQRHRNGADHRCRPECDRPFRKITHGDGHAVSLLHAVLIDQPPRQGGCGTIMLAKGDALVAEDDVGAVTPKLAGLEDRAEIPVGLFVNPDGTACDVERFRLERSAGSGQDGVSLLERDRGPIASRAVHGCDLTEVAMRGGMRSSPLRTARPCTGHCWQGDSTKAPRDKSLSDRSRCGLRRAAGERSLMRETAYRQVPALSQFLPLKRSSVMNFTTR